MKQNKQKANDDKIVKWISMFIAFILFGLMVWGMSSLYKISEGSTRRLIEEEFTPFCEKNNLSFFEGAGGYYCVHFEGDILERKYAIRRDENNSFFLERAISR